ncbi:MAG: hypothetical protein RL341_1278 [Pseudomonadota bacterium]|jgi:hypothetical protein
MYALLALAALILAGRGVLAAAGVLAQLPSTNEDLVWW